MGSFKLTIEYKGTRYGGFQRQPKVQTIQGELEKALKVLLREQVKVVGASRTDAGVHATGQVVSFQTATQMAEERILKGLNGLLPGDIVVKAVSKAPAGFHARRDAVSREYFYLIWNEPYPSGLRREFVWWVPQELDLGAMKRALKMIVGTHDFASFCVAASSAKGCVRTVKKAQIGVKDSLILIKIEADAFVHQMVRAIVGTLLQVGLGKREPKEMKEILESRDRRRAGETAPAHALVLTEVKYEDIHT